MKVDLSNRIALVTGAAQGLGRAIADCLADNGATVVYSDLAYGSVEAAARETGGMPLVMDVSSEEQVETGLSKILERYKKIDILVNNAGINNLSNRVPIDQYSLEDWERIIRVDLTGVFLVSQPVSRQMVAQGSGSIINICSVAGTVPLRLQSAYIAAKAGVANLTKSMALELGPRGVLVNGIAPGSILTPAAAKLFYGDNGSYKESTRQLLDHIPLGRPGRPEDIAHAALFLAAPESSYINGHILTVDGGWTAGYHRDF